MKFVFFLKRLSHDDTLIIARAYIIFCAARSVLMPTSNSKLKINNIKLTNYLRSKKQKKIDSKKK